MIALLSFFSNNESKHLFSSLNVAMQACVALAVLLALTAMATDDAHDVREPWEPVEDEGGSSSVVVEAWRGAFFIFLFSISSRVSSWSNNCEMFTKLKSKSWILKLKP